MYKRQVPPDATIAKAKCLEGKEGTIEISARNEGSWGNSVTVSFEASSSSKTQILEDLGEGKYRLKSVAGFDVGDVVELEGSGKPQFSVVTNVTGNNVTFSKPFEGEVVDAGLLPKIVVKTCEMNVVVEEGETVEKYADVSFNVLSPLFIEKVMAKSEIVRLAAKPLSLIHI